MDAKMRREGEGNAPKLAENDIASVLERVTNMHSEITSNVVICGRLLLTAFEIGYGHDLGACGGHNILVLLTLLLSLSKRLRLRVREGGGGRHQPVYSDLIRACFALSTANDDDGAG